MWHCTIKEIAHVQKHFLMLINVRRIVLLLLQKRSDYFCSIVNQQKALGDPGGAAGTPPKGSDSFILPYKFFET